MNFVTQASRVSGRYFAALSVAFLTAAACSSSKTGLGADQGCSLASDCQSGLFCAFGRCSVVCRTAADCTAGGAGGACVVDSMMQAVCQYPSTQLCEKQSDCAAPLACASDYRCRNLCATAADCNVLGITGRVCAKDTNGVDYCAQPSEVSADGTTIVAAPPSNYVPEEGGPPPSDASMAIVPEAAPDAAGDSPAVPEAGLGPDTAMEGGVSSYGTVTGSFDGVTLPNIVSAAANSGAGNVSGGMSPSLLVYLSNDPALCTHLTGATRGREVWPSTTSLAVVLLSSSSAPVGMGGFPITTPGGPGTTSDGGGPPALAFVSFASIGPQCDFTPAPGSMGTGTLAQSGTVNITALSSSSVSGNVTANFPGTGTPVQATFTNVPICNFNVAVNTNANACSGPGLAGLGTDPGYCCGLAPGPLDSGGGGG